MRITFKDVPHSKDEDLHCKGALNKDLDERQFLAKTCPFVPGQVTMFQGHKQSWAESNSLSKRPQLWVNDTQYSKNNTVVCLDGWIKWSWRERGTKQATERMQFAQRGERLLAPRSFHTSRWGDTRDLTMQQILFNGSSHFNKQIPTGSCHKENEP